MSTNQPTSKDEEVDLGSLFRIIGKGFSNFFNFIGDIFKGIFHFLILVLIFFRKHVILIGSAALIGFVAGFLLELNSPDTFKSDMLVAPNFKSTQQLYNNITYYNDLIKQKDTLRIQTTFNVDKKIAASLKRFSIKAVINENDIINSYNKFALEVDTATVSSYPFKEFNTSFKDLDYKIHRITVIAEKNDVFKKLDEVILSSVVTNKYFNRLKELTNRNLNRTDLMYRQNLMQLDSLRRVYMQVMLAEAKKESSNGTNIAIGGGKTITKEIEVFKINREINEDLERVVRDRSEKYEVINVISNFQPIGSEVKGIANNKAVKLAVLGSLLMIFVLLLLRLNTFLNTFLSTYKK